MKNHKAIVTSALKAYRRIAFNHRYGAMMDDYRLAQQALDSIQFLQQVDQPALLSTSAGRVAEHIETKPDA